MVHIRKIKTWYGLKYAVVDLVDTYRTHVDKNGKVSYEKVKEYQTVDYEVEDEVFPAIFPLTEEGLNRAKEVQKLYKKRQKK